MLMSAERGGRLSMGTRTGHLRCPVWGQLAIALVWRIFSHDSHWVEEWNDLLRILFDEVPGRHGCRRYGVAAVCFGKARVRFQSNEWKRWIWGWLPWWCRSCYPSLCAFCSAVLSCFGRKIAEWSRRFRRLSSLNSASLRSMMKDWKWLRLAILVINSRCVEMCHSKKDCCYGCWRTKEESGEKVSQELWLCLFPSRHCDLSSIIQELARTVSREISGYQNLSRWLVLNIHLLTAPAA